MSSNPKTVLPAMEEIIKTLPQHTSSWLKGSKTLFKYQDFWIHQEFLEGGILAQQSFKAEPSNVFICSYPKTGTTWLKALAFATVTRQKFDQSRSPLLTTMPHDCVPFLEKNIKQLLEDRNNESYSQLVATHLPYASLPDSIIASNCKIVYVYRNIKDVIVSYYHFLIKAMKKSTEDAPFKDVFDEFYQGISSFGPYWNHILGFWKASLERPELFLLLKYEDMKRDPTSNVKRLAEFIGHPFSTEEVEAGVVDNITKLCSFENLSNLEVNKIGMRSPGGIENQSFFRKAKDGDWENYFTDEMKEKIDKLIDEKLTGTGLVLK